MSDYIRREDVVIKAKEHGFNCALSGVLTSILNEVPAADVRENVRGEWIEGRGDDCTCSKCHYESLFFYGGKRCKSDFCPNCGADMRGEKDG